MSTELMPAPNEQASFNREPNSEFSEKSVEVQAYTNMLDALSKWEKSMLEHGRNQRYGEGEATYGDHFEELKAKIANAYYKALSNTTDRGQLFAEFEGALSNKFPKDAVKHKEFYDVAEKELVMRAISSAGYTTRLVSPREMNGYKVDFAIDLQDNEFDALEKYHNAVYVSVVHRTPVLEFPDGQLVFNAHNDPAETLLDNENIDAKNTRNLANREFDIKEKRTAFINDYAAKEEGHERLIRQELEDRLMQGSQDLRPNGSAIITLPNTRTGENLEVNSGFAIWKSLEPGNILIEGVANGLDDDAIMSDETAYTIAA